MGFAQAVNNTYSMGNSSTKTHKSKSKKERRHYNKDELKNTSPPAKRTYQHIDSQTKHTLSSSLCQRTEKLHKEIEKAKNASPIVGPTYPEDEIKQSIFYRSDEWECKKQAPRPNPNQHTFEWTLGNLSYRKMKRTQSLTLFDRHYTPFPHRGDQYGPQRLDAIDRCERIRRFT